MSWPAICNRAYRLACPVDAEVAGGKALAFARLPALVGSGWADKVDPEILLCGHQKLGIQVARVDDVHSG